MEIGRPAKILPAVSSLAIALLSAEPCAASTDPWEFEVYPYGTLAPGAAEFETNNAIVSSGHKVGGEGTSKGIFQSHHLWYNSYEVTYGLTERIEAALYMDMAQPNGAGLRWAGSKLRLRGRLFEQDTLPVNLGWYLELEWHKTPQFDDALRELEFRPIIEKDFGPLEAMLNPKFEKTLAGAGHSRGIEFGYVAAIRYRISRRASPALEFYGATGLIDQADPNGSQQHYIFPSVWGELPCGIEYNVGVGYGLTRGSDRMIFKVNLEIERFVGRIFGHASERGWFL